MGLFEGFQGVDDFCRIHILQKAPVLLLQDRPCFSRSIQMADLPRFPGIDEP